MPPRAKLVSVQVLVTLESTTATGKGQIHQAGATISLSGKSFNTSLSDINDSVQRCAANLLDINIKKCLTPED